MDVEVVVVVVDAVDSLDLVFVVVDAEEDKDGGLDDDDERSNVGVSTVPSLPSLVDILSVRFLIDIMNLDVMAMS